MKFCQQLNVALKDCNRKLAFHETKASYTNLLLGL
jgi:hypothetical protein